MSMGQRIRQARMEAGLSQRQLAGDMMTRNMLSALEHDGANPSVTTLKYLSDKLCKPISYFLGEDIPSIPELAQMEEVRSRFTQGQWAACLRLLEGLEQPAFEAERSLLEAVCLLEMAEEAEKTGKRPYSRELLQQSEAAIGRCPYMKEALDRKRTIAAARAAEEKELPALAARIPPQEDVLLLRARGAVADGAYDRARRLLEAVEDRRDPQWHFLRGEIHLAQQEYANAAQCYLKAEQTLGEKTWEKLEICYREMGDYKMAYYYAKKGKNR